MAQVTVYDEVGLNFFKKCFGIQPFLGLEYQWLERKGIHEHGGDPLNLDIKRQDVNTFNTFLGLHFSKSFHRELTVGADISWEQVVS